MKSIPYRRLAGQRIAGSSLHSPHEVARQLGALQAQDYHQAIWAVGARLNSGTVSAVEKSIADREILQTWSMRGTIHFVPAEDAGWMVKLLAPRVMARDQRRLEQLELSLGIIEQAKEIIRRALQGGGRFTRSALMAVLEGAGIGTSGQRGYHILWHAAQSGLICLGPREGKEQTFVLLDEWQPAPRDLCGEEALAELAGRYFTGHGPATEHDFAWWAGLTLKEARLGIQAAGSRLISEASAGRTYWTAAASRFEAVDERPAVCLLPGFDEYLLGYKDRQDVLRPEYANAVVPGGNGVFKPMVVIDGQVAGIWKRTAAPNRVDVDIQLFAPDTEREGELREAALRYCAFMERPAGSIRIGGRE